jgi:hypothetical protein
MVEIVHSVIAPIHTLYAVLYLHRRVLLVRVPQPQLTIAVAARGPCGIVSGNEDLVVGIQVQKVGRL